jgi:branched-chain amino acid transport system ATP-binding protein
VLRAEGITVRFGGVLALDQVSIEALPGRVTGLIGPNGAGKTTLFNVVSGLQRPTAGQVVLGTRDVTRLGPRRRARLGLGRTFQRLEVFGSLTVRENVLIAAEVKRGWLHGRGPDLDEATDALLERTGLAAQSGSLAAELPTGAARLLELARALATQPSVLLLDEPGSGLDENETRDLGELLTQLARQGMAVLLVEHDVELVMRVCDHVYVLDFGQLLCDGPPALVAADPRVQEAYLGAEVVADAEVPAEAPERALT